MTNALISVADTASQAQNQVYEEEVKQEITLVEPRAEGEEKKEAVPIEEEKWAINLDQLHRRYWVGNYV